MIDGRKGNTWATYAPTPAEKRLRARFLELDDALASVDHVTGFLPIDKTRSRMSSTVLERGRASAVFAQCSLA